MKNSDSLKQFLTLRDSLMEEKADLLKRLAKIEKVLTPTSPSDSSPSGGQAKLATVVRRRPGRKAGQSSLKSLICQLTASKPLTKAEIGSALRKARRPFSKAYLNLVLYRKGSFKRVDGKFAPAG